MMGSMFAACADEFLKIAMFRKEARLPLPPMAPAGVRALKQRFGGAAQQAINLPKTPTTLKGPATKMPVSRELANNPRTRATMLGFV